jgi:valyl-tRNA synthetase
MHLEDYEEKTFEDYEYLDKWILGRYAETEQSFLNYLEDYEVGLGLNTLEKFFWNFCDNYIEIVKHRLYRPEEFGDKARFSGQKTIYTILYKLLQNFSIYFPFVTEEIFQGIFNNHESIHTTVIEPLDLDFKDEIKYGNQINEIISKARGVKTDQNVSLKTPIKNIELELSSGLADAFNQSIKDISATLFIENINITGTSSEEDFVVKTTELNLEKVE